MPSRITPVNPALASRLHSLLLVGRVTEFRRCAAFAFPESMTEHIIQGGCLCGAVRYEVTGRPYNITHCHCMDCRRGSGAAFVTWASSRRADFRFTQGEPRVMSWAGRLRTFCTACGTPLTFLTAPLANEVDVTVCSFDHPESISPADHTWIDDRLPWIRLVDDLPAYGQKRPKHAAQ